MTSPLEPKPECCPEFDPIPWDDKIFNWENKRFIKDKVETRLIASLLFYRRLPQNFHRMQHFSTCSILNVVAAGSSGSNNNFFGS